MIFCICGGVIEGFTLFAIFSWFARVIFRRKPKARVCKHTTLELTRAELPLS